MNINRVIANAIWDLFPEGSPHNIGEARHWDLFWSRKIDFIKQHGVPWELSSLWAKRMYTKQIDVFNNLAEDVSGKKILEAGCGSGFVTINQLRRGADVYLSDTSLAALQYAQLVKQHLNIDGDMRVVLSSFTSLPYPDNYFDIVWNNGVIEHYDQSIHLLDDMIRVTKPGGKVIVAVPNLMSPELLFSAYRFGRGTERYFSLDDLSGYLSECGLTDVRAKPVSAVLPSCTPEGLLRKMSFVEGVFKNNGILFYGCGSK